MKKLLIFSKKSANVDKPKVHQWLIGLLFQFSYDCEVYEILEMRSRWISPLPLTDPQKARF